MDDKPRDIPGVIAFPPLIYAAGGIVGLVLHRLRPIQLLPRPLSSVLGAGLIAAGGLLVRSAFATMNRAQTNIDPFAPTTTIVTNGPFHYTRNPIYLSLVLIYAGISALFNSLTMLVPLPIVLLAVQRGVIEREEQYLERKFGDEYTQYKVRVRRWI
jgi:protein-S-isoprenylcysteine O-methyltransferase Ste14